MEVSDSEYESSSDSINSEEDLSTACIEDCDDDDAIEEWIMSLDDVLKNPVMVDEVQLGNRLFSISDFEELKEKEKILMERKKSGYYRDKIRHKTAYAKICESYSKYITRDMLKMLHHTWSTQKNESLNKSVTCYAPKDRTYSKTNSLDTRVAVAGAIQEVGYYSLWKQIFDFHCVRMDDSFKKYLKIMDLIKKNKLKGHQQRKVSSDGVAKNMEIQEHSKIGFGRTKDGVRIPGRCGSSGGKKKTEE